MLIEAWRSGRESLLITLDYKTCPHSSSVRESDIKNQQSSNLRRCKWYIQNDFGGRSLLSLVQILRPKHHPHRPINSDTCFMKPAMPRLAHQCPNPSILNSILLNWQEYRIKCDIHRLCLYLYFLPKDSPNRQIRLQTLTKRRYQIIE